MENYPVPQFIEEEGKIVFFLTFRQFFLLVGGGAVCFILFFALPLIFFIICAIPVMSLVATIAFVKINDIPIIKVVLNYLGFITGAKNYTWKKENLSYQSKNQAAEEVKGIQVPEPVYKPTPDLREQRSRLGEVKKIIEMKK